MTADDHTTPHKLHPSEGARFLLERDTCDDDAATYSAAIFTVTERFNYDAKLAVNGDAVLALANTGTAEPAPKELEKKLHTIARVIARDAKRQLERRLPPWPQRVLRWRGLC